MKQVLTRHDIQDWKIEYRYTPTDRRRVQFVAPDGARWEVVPAEKATHVRKHKDGLSPTYLKVVP